MFRLTPRFLLVPLLALAASCSTPRGPYELDYTQYPKLPQAPTSSILRTVAYVVPGLKSKAIYGNYGGPGSKPGAPVDDMDEIFRRHDIAYFEGVTLDELRESDRTLIHRLKAIDPSGLSKKAAAYRDRAIRFFESATSKTFGKPRDVIEGRKKPLTVIPGKREDAEKLWQWRGTDPDASSGESATLPTAQKSAGKR